MLPYDKKGDKHKQLTELVTNYLISGIVPLYTVEKQSFINMLKGFDSRYQCPSRNYFSKTIIPSKYLEEKTRLTQALTDISYISLTSDGWSSLARDPYMSLTAHYVDKEWRLQTKCLATTYLPESHTADNIANFVKETLDEYNVEKSKIVSMTTDSAANMVAACARLSFTRFSCFGHILHNAVTTTLNTDEGITSLSTAVRKIVSVFSYSFLYKRKLAKLQKDLNLPENKLTNDVSTRWGSRLKMFKSVQQQLPGIDQLFVDDRKYRSLLLSFEQKDRLKCIVYALSPYEELTNLLSGEKMVTSTSVAPMLLHIYNLCGETDSPDFDIPAHADVVKDIRQNIWTYIQLRYTNKDVNKLLAAGTVLDRRYEYAPPDNDNWPTMDEVKSFIIEVSMRLTSSVKGSNSDVTVTRKDTVGKKKSLATVLGKRKETDEPMPDKTPEQVARKELDFLLTMECDSEMEVIDWWAVRAKEFPYLSMVAKELFCVNATSVASERLFSLSGHIVSKKRTSLRPAMVNMLTVLAFNYR